jgi:protein SCO1/2
MVTTTMRRVVMAGALTLVSAVASAQYETPGMRPQPGAPADQMPGVLKQVDFEQRLGSQLPLDAAFTDEAGQPVTLGTYFGQKPVVVAFVYYECPMLCTEVLNGLTSTLGVLDESVGRQFDVVTISFEPRETAVLASAKKKTYLDRYKRPGAEQGWHFLTGPPASIEAVTRAAGFKYTWDPQTAQYAHASGILVATPQGQISQYFFGLEYAPRDVKFALMEASGGRIGSVVEKLLLYCYHYDPQSGSYAFVAMKAVRVGSAITLVALVGFVAIAIRREHRAAGH